MLPDVVQRLARPPDVVVTYHLAQALSGHGAFRAFLYSRRRALDPGCPYCPEVWDDVEHTLFVCPHFGAARGDLGRLLDRDPEPEDIGPILCGERARRVTR